MTGVTHKIWQRVSRRRPCAICQKEDWCGVTADGAVARCMRVESSQPSAGGWLHRLRPRDQVQPTRRRVIQPMTAGPAANGDLEAEVERAAGWCDNHPKALCRFAQSLGVSTESLQRLSIGYSPSRRAWVFPMRDATGRVIGVRLRLPSGAKLAIRGSREGLFLPDGLKSNRLLLIAEGATDCAALLDLGFGAVGRASCAGGVTLLVELVRRRQPSELVIVADADMPGQRGAANLASVLVAYCPAVRVITPPRGTKDARAWLQTGATAADVAAVIGAAPVRKLEVSARLRRKVGEHRGSWHYTGRPND